MIFAGYSLYKMVYNNRVPYTLECKAVKLDRNKTYAISNAERKSADTLYINFQQSRVIMPATLGYVYYDHSLREFVLKNNACVFNPNTSTPGNYFLPFARTLRDDGFFPKGKYFGGSEIIREGTLIKNGIKYNTAVGTPENRVSVELLRYGSDTYLKTKDDGIGTRYLVQADTANVYAVVLNQPATTNAANVFLFDNTTSGTGNYSIEITANTFSASYTVKDAASRIQARGSGASQTFEIAGYLFTITPRYTAAFAFFYLAFFIALAVFQTYFLILYTRTGSPVVKALFSIRILFNCIAYLATPIFLTAWYLTENRNYYLFLLLLLNGSFFISKKLLHDINLARHTKIITKLALVLIPVTTLLMIKFTHNESLFSVPVLHVQKLLILLLIFVTHGVFKSHKYGHLLRFGIIILFSLLVSAITSDVGSFIYASLAFLLVELIWKTISLRTALLGVLCLVAAIFIAYKLYPEKLSERKFYRLVAPYTSPASPSLEAANEADRETYSTVFLNLKNVVELKSPFFNNAVVPSNMRSTCHSDFAFLWSFSFGGWSFLILFISVAFMLISNLVLLLFCSIRECRIRNDRSFVFPRTREAELIRFLLALTIISIIYPITSNLLIVPLTGQSVPVLSISNYEVIFLTILLVSLSSIFTNEKYIVTGSTTHYYYGDARVSMKYALFFVASLLVTALVIRYLTLRFLENSMTWKKHYSDESMKLDAQIPPANDKEGLVHFAKNLIGTHNLVSVAKNKKPLLKNLASLYYANMPYAQTVFEPSEFSNSTERVLNQMAIDKVFDTRSRVISGPRHPFGIVYAFNQQINNQQKIKVTNPYYNCIPVYTQTINADLTAECNRGLEAHLAAIGVDGNIGAVMIARNDNGNVVTNSSYPLISTTNSNDIYYFPGSLKKLLIAYSALRIDPSYKDRVFGSKTFQQFIQASDDFYAASLLKELLQFHRDELNEVLKNDFDLPLYSTTDDAYLDAMPVENDFRKPLDRNNTIYRQAIGQQRPYKFSQVLQWYVRVASGLKAVLNYTGEQRSFETQSLNDEGRTFLLHCLNTVLNGTASMVRVALKNNGIDTKDMTCKTGSAEASTGNYNSSSSFVLSTKEYTIGIMLKGNIPHNESRLAAKDLFVSLIPILKKYEVLK